LYFCVTLLPALGFIDVGYMKFALVADHYQYLSLIAVVALAATLWSRWRQRAFDVSPNAADFMAIFVIGSLMLLCWGQSRLYAENFKLYSDALEKNPNSHILHALIGYAHEEQGRLDLASGEYRRATELRPTEAKYFNNLGVALAHLGQYREAVVNFERAIRLRPDMAECYRNTAWAISNLGKWKDAVELCRHAVKLDPHDYRALRFLGIALLKDNQTAEAANQFHACLAIDPHDAEIWWYLATAQAALHQEKTAMATAEQALKLAREQRQPMLTQEIESLLRKLRAGQPQP
jgi:protein O-mannosyl-transferase